MILTAGRLAVCGRLAVSGRGLAVTGGGLAVSGGRSLERACLLPRPERRAIAEELNDHENRQYERVEEQHIMPSPKEQQEVEPVASESRSEDGVRYSPCLVLAALYARNDEHRDSAENEERDIQIEQHFVYLAIDANNPAAWRVPKVADRIAKFLIN